MPTRKTYITRMPDKAGAFLHASRVISSNGGNIVRVNYNKAVDLHTLFIEVSAEESQHLAISQGLSQCGYLTEDAGDARVLMIVLTLRDVPGAVTPVLEIISRYKVNISYISSQENGTGWQHFKMGLLIENTDEITRLIEDISQICEISILDYEVTDKLLDGTVFYVTFANRMREILGLDQDTTNRVLIEANQLMQLLDEQGKSPLQVFDYIMRFAKFVTDRRGDAFNPLIERLELEDGLSLYAIYPPCGSNTYVLECRDDLLFIDCGFACYSREMGSLFRSMFHDFGRRGKTAFITHGDVDHTGILDMFQRVYMSRGCYENFKAQHLGEPDFRESNPLHAPYCALSKIISRYSPPDLSRCLVVGDRRDSAILSPIGQVDFAGHTFSFYEGPGGHVPGETIIVSETLKILFSGDIYVNIKGFSPEQREFNSLAPFLMTGVDCDPEAAKRCREFLLKEYGGYLFCPGHGPVQRVR